MLALSKITWARISARNVVSRYIIPGEICRDFSNAIDESIPTKPKKPATPFLRYLHEQKISIVEEYPTATWQDIMKVAAEKWRLCSPEFKKPYEETYQQEKKDYLCKLESFKSELTESQKAVLEEITDEKAKKREKAKLRKGMAELGKPKPPPGPYALFFSTKKGQKLPGETLTQWATRIGSEWKNMPDIEKQPFFEQSKALRLQYEKDIDLWRKEALQVESLNPAVKKAQNKIKLQEERRRDQLLNIEPPSESRAIVSTESEFCINSKASEGKSVVTANTSEPGPLLTESEESLSVQTKLIEPSSSNSAITKILSSTLSFYQRLIKSASRITSWDFSKLRTVAENVKIDVFQ